MKYKSKHEGLYIVLLITYWMLNSLFSQTMFFTIFRNLIPLTLLAVFIYEYKAERKFQMAQGLEPEKMRRSEVVILLLILAAFFVGMWTLIGR